VKLAFPATRTASRTLGTDPALLWDILSDYAGWTEWLPLVSASTVTARESNFARVDVELAAFPGRKISTEALHTPNSRVLMKSIRGEDPEFILDWTLTPAGPGQTTVAVKCIWVHTPANFKAGVSALNPDLWLSALANQAASYTADPATGPQDPSTLLEIYETEGEGLICWYRGKKYEMKAVS
jgi:ribosome-associated toxin RatA of RatAB toxin-antitoxin module